MVPSFIFQVSSFKTQVSDFLTSAGVIILSRNDSVSSASPSTPPLPHSITPSLHPSITPFPSQQMVIEDGFDGFAMGLAQYGIADAQKDPLFIDNAGQPTTGIQL